MKALKITADGNVDQIEVNGYEDLKEHIGGWLEGLHLTDDMFAYIDEEGKMKGLPYNVLATALCQVKQVGLAPTDFISGTMLIVGSPDEEGNDTNVPFNLEYNLSVLAREVAATGRSARSKWEES